MEKTTDNKENKKSSQKVLTPLELKNKLLEQRKEVNKKLRLLEKKEKEKRLKPLFSIFEKNIHKLSDEELEKMVEYYKKKFAEK
jgi:isopropylmalate/homocitrate/citramalate synthase